MSAVAVRPRMVDYDPLRDKSYQSTRLGPSIIDFLAWAETGGMMETTLDQYERDLARGAQMYPNTPLEDWTDAQMLQVAKQFKPAERRVRVAAWRSFFKWGLGSRKITLNPCDALPKMAQPKRKDIDVFSDEEIEVLCDLPLRDGALMQLLLDSGLRKGEARRFRLQHLRDRHVIVLGGKGGQDRKIPASAAVVARINELALLDGINRQDHLWYATKKTPQTEARITRGAVIAEGTFHRWWERCLKDAGVRYRNPHTTRHTFATRYLRRGGTLERLSMAMGHSSIQITFDLYAHLDMRDLDAEFAEVFGQ